MSKLDELVERIRGAAVEYRALTGRPLGVTGEIGEIEAARLLGYQLAPVRSPGYDAIDPQGRRLQVKTRCYGADAKPGQRLGSIKLEAEWDAVLLVLLDEDLTPLSIWEADRGPVEQALLAPGSRARNERGALAVAQFKKIGKQVWGSETAAGMKVGRGKMHWSDVALLTPVPHEHLISGLPICETAGRVAFGSDSVEVMSIVAAEAREAQVRVLFYASHAPDAFPSRVTWSGVFVGLEGSKTGRHPHHDRLRPPTTASDGPWQIFYEVSNLVALPPAQQLLLTQLKKRKGASLSKSFLPIGPVLIENPL